MTDKDSIEKVIATLQRAIRQADADSFLLDRVIARLTAIQAQGGEVEAVARVVAVQPLELTATVKMKALLNGVPSLNMGDSLYTAPPAPAVPEGWALVPDRISPHEAPMNGVNCTGSYAQGWNACREATIAAVPKPGVK